MVQEKTTPAAGSRESLLLEWALTCETGASSVTLAAAAVGMTPCHCFPPFDMHDSHKCEQLAERCPFVVDALPGLIERDPRWAKWEGRIREAAARAGAAAQNGEAPGAGRPRKEGGGTMSNVFEGAADARQTDRVDEPMSRFRPRYRALTDADKALHDAIKAKAAQLEALFEQVKPGRYRSLGLTALEESVMWTVKELTS